MAYMSLRMGAEYIEAFDRLVIQHDLSRPQLVRIALDRFAATPPTPDEIARTEKRAGKDFADPTPEEIREACAEIQAEWTEPKPPKWTPPTTRNHRAD